jgi:hypothetical protein
MTHVSTLDLHRFRLGELDGPRADDVRAHLGDCSRCAERLGTQHAVRAEFERQPIPLSLVRAASEAAAVDVTGSRGHTAPSAWGRARLAAAIALPLAAAAALVVRMGVEREGGGLAEAGTRVKGLEQGIEAWVMSGESPRPVYAGERVRAGSRVQLKYRPGGHRWVTLAGKDGLGQVEIYGTVPSTGTALGTAPFSLTLDDTPGPQRFYAIAGDRKLDPAEVLGALRVEPVAVAGSEVAMVEIAKE